MKERYISGMLTLLLAFQVNIYGQDRLDGTAAVTATGGASYTVQIQTPKGVGDLKPSISLTYSSQSGNGVAGFGCSITGIPVITRGVKNYLYNETPKGIKYTTSDALYMDGKRLIRKSGTEGTDGSVYSPEGEPFTTITLHGTSTSTASWFEVDTNDGMTYEFGRAAGTQQTTTVSSSEVPCAWYISKGTNTLGQTITYQYQTADRYLYPQTISYGSGNSVAFEYEARTDSIRFVLNGQKGCVGRRLRSITSKAGSNVYRTYTMSYNSTSDASATKFSRLTYITETGTTGNGSRRITLGWNYLRSFSAPSSTVNIIIPEDDNLHEYGERYLVAADFNGDGVSDLVHLSPVKEYAYHYANASRWSLYTYAHIYRSAVSNGVASLQSPILFRFPENISIGDWTFQKGGMCVADLDGDGINDLILPGSTNATPSGAHAFYFHYALGKNIATNSALISQMGFTLTNSYELPLYSITDIDCDGKSDLIVLEKQHANGRYLCHIAHVSAQESIHNISLTLTGKPRKLFTGDYNGDGMVDMLIICDDGYRIFYGQGGVVSANSFTDSSTLVSLSDVHHRIEQGDFNGDGIPDFIWNDHGSSRIYFSLGNGDGTFTRKLAYTLPYTVFPKNTDSGTWCFLVADLDHDGKSDVVINARDYSAGRTYTHWLMSDGTKLILKRTASSNRESDAKAGHICVGDFKGQGWLEVMNYGYDCWSGSNADVSPSLHLYGSSVQKVSDGKLFSATNSDGRTTSFTYGSMTSDLLYTKGTGSTYPLADVAAPLCVVSRMRESGASSVIRQTDYTYKGLRAHLKGRGLLGFTEQRAKESYTGLTTTARITGWNTQYYVPVSMSTTTSQGGFTTTSVSTNIISVHGNNYMRYPSSQTETDIYGNVTTTTFNYNTSKGYLTKRRTEFGGSNMYRQTEYTYSTSKIGKAYRPLTVKETQKHSDSTQPYTTTTKYTYNSNGLPTKVVERNGTPMALTTDYVYDSHGNVTKETVSGAGITTPRETNYQYSGNKFLTQRTTTPASTTITYGRNAFGEVMALLDMTCVGSSTQPLVTSYIRNGFGMVTKETKPSGEVTTYSRTTNSNGSGYTVTVTKAGGGTVTTKYDALDNELSRETKGVGGTVIKTTNTYNSKGLLTTRAKQKGSLTITESMGYDALGRMTRHTSTSGTNVSYSYGNRTTTTTDNGRQYVRTFDAWGNVTESADPVSSVSYTYHSNGKPSSASSENATVYMEYDAAGNQIRLEDPDAGICTYEYDALGRVIRQTDARGNETSYTYDAVGRLTARNCEGTVTSYTYGTSGYDKERLVREQTADRTVTYAYNSKGLLASETRSMTGETPVTFTYQYDGKGRLISKGFPKGVTVNYKYNSFGIQSGCDIGGHCTGLVSLDNGLTKTVLYGGTLQMDLDLQVQQPELILTTSNDSRGFLTGMSMMKVVGGATQLRNMTYNFDGATGNLLSRTGMTAQQETFEYDDLDRLLRIRQGNSVAQQMEYADNGNMESKSWIGDFHYDGQQPHAVTSVDNDLGYIPSTTQQATYTVFGKVESLTDGAYNMTFTYGPDEERWKTVLKQNGTVERTTFYAGDYERVTENGVTRHFYYLDNGCIYVIEGSQSTGTYYYAFTDHLGSVTRIFNESGGTVFEAEYDAWGRQAVSKNTIGFHRGYTGHEMLPEFGLINMNGRLYDPMLGRFLSPDNYVQMPDFSQSFNRYSYCINNPLKYNDPSGEFWHLILGAIIGGTMNLIMNAPNVDNFWEGLGYFGIGATAGALSAGIGSGVNVAMAGGSFGAGFMGTAAGISSTGFIAGALTGAASGFTGAFITSAGNSWMNGASFGDGLAEGFMGGTISAITSGIIGGVIGGVDALEKGTNFWTGKTTFNLSEAYCAHGYKVGENTLFGKYVGEFEGVNVFENETFFGDIGEGGNLRGATFPGKGILVSKGVYTSGKPDGKALLQHEFGHILQSREVGIKAYYSVIAPESVASAARSVVDPSYSHDHFWTETWANYLSKEYFGNKWYGYKFKSYYTENISFSNRLRLYIAKYSPFMPF